MGCVFVSYRRKDSQGEAGRLFDDLVSRFGHESVFMDVSAIEPGRDFRKAIDHSVTTCSILLALIGQDWLDARDAYGNRRLDDANDFVRLELASALRRDIPVVPVLVRGARMPGIEHLPEDLRELAYRNAVELTHARWKSDVHLLIEALRPYVDPVPADRTEAAARHVTSTSQAAPETSRRFFSQHAGAAETQTAIQPATLERVSHHLAGYVGPVAELIVKAAARRCSTPQDLIAAVAREIDDDAERSRFFKACRD